MFKLAEDWDHISQGVKSLIKKMLCLNPKKRIDAQSALSDPWITDNNHTESLKKNIIDNLINFQVGIV